MNQSHKSIAYLEVVVVAAAPREHVLLLLLVPRVVPRDVLVVHRVPVSGDEVSHAENGVTFRGGGRLPIHTSHRQWCVAPNTVGRSDSCVKDENIRLSESVVILLHVHMYDHMRSPPSRLALAG